MTIVNEGDLVEPAPTVSLAEVIAHLNFRTPPSDGGTKLQGYIDAAISLIEDYSGPIVTQTVDNEIHDGGDVSIYLREPPVISIVSIVEVIGIVPYNLTLQPVGQPVDNFGFSLDSAEFGIITRRSAGSQQFPFYANGGNITVTYIAGMEGTPPNLRLAILEQIRHLWQIGQQGSLAEFGALEDKPGAGKVSDGYAMPNRVRQLLGVKGRRLPVIG